MCGIFVRVRRRASQPSESTCEEGDRLRSLVGRRGPDHRGEALADPGQLPNDLKALIFASVLHLRSKALVPQPVETNEGNILAFNGELYSGVEGLDVKDVSDTKILSNLLRGAEDEAGVSDVFCHVRGEFAFVFYHARTRRLWFGRDRLGRRSLLWRRSVEGELDLVSVAKRGKDWEEVPTLGIFSLPLVSEPKALSSTLTLHRWCAEADSATDQAMFHSGTPIDIPPLYERNNLRILPEAIPWEKETPFAEISSLIDSTVNSFETVLRTAVKRRVCNIPDLGDRVPKLAVLFSGGLDCTVLAYLAATSLSDGVLIDLINVAFENPRALAAKANGTTSKEAIALPDEVKYCVPDRVTARQSYANLIAALPRSSFRLVEVNVPYTEVEEQRAHILDLMAPSATVMDLSIAMAFWFATRAIGATSHSLARVLLSGLGADELLGGYSRHRAKFYEGGWTALMNELTMDLDRLPSRNLGRDDRIVADHGKEVRLPFLDEDVVRFCSSIAVHEKCDPRLDQGTGDKLLLRLLAHRLGLSNTAFFKKRAIQFGARTAKMETGDRGARGNDVIE